MEIFVSIWDKEHLIGWEQCLHFIIYILCLFENGAMWTVAFLCLLNRRQKMQISMKCSTQNNHHYCHMINTVFSIILLSSPLSSHKTNLIKHTHTHNTTIKFSYHKSILPHTACTKREWEPCKANRKTFLTSQQQQPNNNNVNMKEAPERMEIFNSLWHNLPSCSFELFFDLSRWKLPRWRPESRQQDFSHGKQPCWKTQTKILSRQVVCCWKHHLIEKIHPAKLKSSWLGMKSCIVFLFQ